MFNFLKHHLLLFLKSSLRRWVQERDIMIIVFPFAPVRSYKEPSILRVQLEKVEHRRVPVRIVQISPNAAGFGGDEENTS